MLVADQQDYLVDVQVNQEVDVHAGNVQVMLLEAEEEIIVINLDFNAMVVNTEVPKLVRGIGDKITWDVRVVSNKVILAYVLVMAGDEDIDMAVDNWIEVWLLKDKH